MNAISPDALAGSVCCMVLHRNLERDVVIHLWLNSLAPGRFHFNFRWVISKLIFVNGGWGITYEIAPRWMLLDLTDDKSTLVLVMAWCRQATSHYLSQCWPRSMLPNGVSRPQWVNKNVDIVNMNKEKMTPKMGLNLINLCILRNNRRCI